MGYDKALQYPQSALEVAGRGAEQILDLFHWMLGGGALIWLGVVSLALYACYKPRPIERRAARRSIIIGGVIFPTLVLTVLLIYALWALPQHLARAPEGALRVHVTGHQYWWRVRYLPPAAPPIELANELRFPVGEPVELLLDSADVIHSFWIPALGGKMDMIPGQQTRLRLDPVRTGRYRGTCAEYCGTAHAWMSFPVVIQEPSELARWLEQQARPANLPAAELAQAGAASFLANGCGGCHTIRGTAADGRVGPDLTHVGSRGSLGAGVLENQRDSLLRWVAYPETAKPGVHMPAFHMLPERELQALSAYLESLK